MEGRVFLCSWKKTRGGYRVWVKGRPKISAEGGSFRQADERLWAAIVDATGDGENTREYVPAPPSEGGAAATPVRLVDVGGNTAVHIKDPEGSLFAGKRCARCGNSTGGRSELPLPIDGVESGYEGGVAVIHEGTFAGGKFAKAVRPFFSDTFLALLTGEERERFTWREVRRAARARKRFYELIASSVNVPLVGARGVEGQGARCEVCGWFSLPFYNASSGGPHSFVCSSDLPDPVPSCFMASHGRDCKLCFTVERWERLAGKPGARGLTSSDIGVLDPGRCEREPPTRTLAEIERDLAKLIGG